MTRARSNRRLLIGGTVLASAVVLGVLLSGLLRAPDMDRRRQVVEMVRSGLIAAGGPWYGDPFALPPSHADLSEGGEIPIFRDSDIFMVVFYERLGVIDQFEGYVYLQQPQELDSLPDIFGSPTDVTTVAPNWYFVVVY